MFGAGKLSSVAILVALLCGVVLAAPSDQPSFPPLEHWRQAVLAGDAAALRTLYSIDPPAFDLPSGGNLLGIEEEVASLIGWHTAGLNRMKLDLIKTVPFSPDLQEIFFQAEIGVATNSGPQTYYFTAKQIWMRQRAPSSKGASTSARAWRIVSASRTEWTRLRKPDSLSANLYPADANPEADIRAALARASANHKRVLLVFGANWCWDCHVLDLAFRHSDLTPLLDTNYELVHVDVGRADRNLPIAARYKVSLEHGLPALAVLDSNGTILYSDTTGEFQNTKRFAPGDLVRFLNRWKAPTAAATAQ